ncbi:nuclear transport factor 2 family protein [Paraglaciecola sp.]|uniref:nuclear transport factor 2 family protein n=1 Tax=Paraglaciecola sp. TaxID=1920173 RepID=UPI0030F3AF2C
MRKIKQIFLFVSLVVSTSSFGQDSPFKTVQNLFSAMSEVSHIKMKNAVTNDFQLLEVGEDWDIDDLIKVVNPSEYSRRNYFNVIKEKSSGDIAWVSYWNKATFTKGELVETVVWLESAVLLREDNNWKIQMLHSTKIKPENLPKNIVLTEYKHQI